MADSIDCIFVDGCGHPRVVPIVGDDLPDRMGYARDGRVTGPDRIAEFEHCPTLEIDGRPVYRQLGMGDPPIRFAYLHPEAAPFNPPKDATAT